MVKIGTNTYYSSQVALANQPWLVEPSLVNIPWQSSVARGGNVKEQLTIGVMMSDGIVDPHPPILRSLKETVMALEAAGHKVIPWKPLSHNEIMAVTLQMYFMDGGKALRDLLQKGGEEPLPLLAMALSLTGPQPSIEQGWEVSSA